LAIGCPDCGTIEDIPPLPRRGTAACFRCDADLEKTTGRSILAAFCCSTTTFLLLFPSNVLPLVRVAIFGQHGENVTAAGIGILFDHGWFFLASLSAIMVIALPFLRFGLLSLVLGSMLLGRRPGWTAPAFRWTIWLDPWAMLDVYLLAACIGIYRLLNVEQLQLSIQPGGMCFITAALLTMLSRATLDQRTVWRAIGGEVAFDPAKEAISCTTCDLVQPISREGEPCPRCGAAIYARKRDAIPRTMALLLAAFILFFPANIYPMNVSRRLGELHTYTIFTGVRELFEAGLWPLGVLVFCTSILIPMGKIVAVAWCVLSVWRGSSRHLKGKTKLFRAVAELGRWSKTDPFVIVFFVPLMNFGMLGSDDAGWGATAFVLMTFLTMIASFTFDPRLMWDAAEGGRNE